MNIPNNLAKSFLLATVIFWTIIGYQQSINDILLYIFISFIPIFICVAIVILGTVCPIFWLAENKNFDKQQVFKMYFPYYAITVFFISVLGIISSNFDVFIIAFFASAFFTTSQSWVWFSKEKNKTIKQLNEKI